MHEVVISDAGPLISLEKISGGFAFLRKMAKHVLIPEAVLLEAGAKSRNPEEYLLDHGIADLTEIVRGIDTTRIAAMAGSRPLHRGEMEALALALERGLPVLLEDEDVRKVAKAADIKFVGIGGLVLAAARQNVVNREEALRLVNGLYAARRITSILRDALIAEFPRQ
jgi:predicted nucleic acid-binding protein